MLDITPLFLKSICVYKKISISELYSLLGLNEYFTLSYFYRLINGSKPIIEDSKIIISNRIFIALTTEELIKAMKIQEYLK